MAESSDEDDSPASTFGDAATRKRPDSNNNGPASGSRDPPRPPKPISPIQSPTSQAAVQTAAQSLDLRQFINNQRQRKFSEATTAAAAVIGQAHRRHSSIFGYAASQPSKLQLFGSAYRFPQQPATQRPQQPPTPQRFIVRPFGGQYTGEDYSERQASAAPGRQQSSFERVDNALWRGFHSSSRPAFGHSAMHDRLHQHQQRLHLRQNEHADFIRPKPPAFHERSGGGSRGGIGGGGPGVVRGGGACSGSLMHSNFAAAEEVRLHCRIVEYSGASGSRFAPATALPPPPPQFSAMPDQRALRVPFGAGYPSATNKTSVRIENCPDGLTEADLAVLTDPLGPVCEYRLVPEYFKAFVRFFNEHQASEFVKRYNRTVFMGLELYMTVIN